MRIPLQMLSELMTLGEQEREEIPPSLMDEDVAWKSLVCGNEPWSGLARELPAPDLEHLIKGIVLYSRASRRSTGGSVSPVKVLYWVLVSRFAEREPALSAWIVDHRTNPYEPFGSMHHREARSLQEFELLASQRRARAAANILAEAERQVRARELRILRVKREAAERLAPAVFRGDLLAVKALLAKGADPSQLAPEGGSLVSYAEANGRNHVAEFLKAIGGE